MFTKHSALSKSGISGQGQDTGAGRDGTPSCSESGKDLPLDSPWGRLQPPMSLPAPEQWAGALATLCDSPGPPLLTWQHEGPPEMSEPGGGGAQVIAGASALGTLKQRGPPQAGTEVHVEGAVSRALSAAGVLSLRSRGPEGGARDPHPGSAAQVRESQVGN